MTSQAMSLTFCGYSKQEFKQKHEVPKPDIYLLSVDDSDYSEIKASFKSLIFI